MLFADLVLAFNPLLPGVDCGSLFVHGGGAEMRRGIGDNVSPGPLFDLARASDPPTSHAAADKLVSSGSHTRQVDLVVEAVGRHPGLTYSELADEPDAQLTVSQFSKRIPDAAKEKRIVSNESRECTVTGSEAATWRIVTNG